MNTDMVMHVCERLHEHIYCGTVTCQLSAFLSKHQGDIVCCKDHYGNYRYFMAFVRPL